MYVPSSYTDWLQQINLTLLNIVKDKLNDRFQNLYAKSKRHDSWRTVKLKNIDLQLFFESRWLRSGWRKYTLTFNPSKNYHQWLEKTRIDEAMGYTFQSVCDIVTSDYRYMYFVHKTVFISKGNKQLMCVVSLVTFLKLFGNLHTCMNTNFLQQYSVFLIRK